MYRSQKIIKTRLTSVIKKIVVCYCCAFLLYAGRVYAEDTTDVSYSIFAEGGDTESVFIIDGRNFPVKVGSLGLKASISPSRNFDVYGKVGFGYSQKQSVSAYNFDLSGSVFATSFGGGATKKIALGNSNFVLMPFTEFNIYNYGSDTFRGDRNGDPLKAKVNGNSTFLRGGIELQYLTQGGYFFLGSGLNKWSIENEIAIKTGNLTISPKVWADEMEPFFQGGVLFNSGNADVIIGMRMSDLTFDINTQLIEVFAEVQVFTDKSK
jgi:hypothetical protein